MVKLEDFQYEIFFELTNALLRHKHLGDRVEQVERDLGYRGVETINIENYKSDEDYQRILYCFRKVGLRMAAANYGIIVRTPERYQAAYGLFKINKLTGVITFESKVPASRNRAEELYAERLERLNGKYFSV